MSMARKIHAARKRSSQPRPLNAEVLLLFGGVADKSCFSASGGWVDSSCESVCNGALDIAPLEFLRNCMVVFVKS